MFLYELTSLKLLAIENLPMSQSLYFNLITLPQFNKPPDNKKKIKNFKKENVIFFFSINSNLR